MNDNNVFEPNTYLIGDLCYFLTPEKWKETGLKIDFSKNEYGGFFTLEDGTHFWMHNTACGDGLYESNIEYLGEFQAIPVDSGSIGIMRVSQIEPRGIQIAKVFKDGRTLILGAVVQMHDAFTPKYECGIFTFGPYKIDTATDDI